MPDLFLCYSQMFFIEKRFVRSFGVLVKCLNTPSSEKPCKDMFSHSCLQRSSSYSSSCHLSRNLSLPFLKMTTGQFGDHPAARQKYVTDSSEKKNGCHLRWKSKTCALTKEELIGSGHMQDVFMCKQVFLCLRKSGEDLSNVMSWTLQEMGVFLSC